MHLPENCTLVQYLFELKTVDLKYNIKSIILYVCSGLQHIEQDERVSMGLNGDLYFSHAVEKDSRRDYCCFAAFPRIRTIVQKTAMSVIVKTSRCHSRLSEDSTSLECYLPLKAA